MNSHHNTIFYNRKANELKKSTTIKKSSLNLENLSTTGNIKSSENNRKSNIKQELFVKLEPQLTKISPTNKKPNRRLSIFEGDMDKNKHLNNKPSLPSTQSSIIDNIKPKRLTKKSVENEKKYLKDFMERSVFNLNDQVINSKLKIPKYNKNANLYRDFLKNRRIDKIKFSSQEMENDRQKLFESNILNPSLGPNYLKKKYSDLPKENLWNFENKFKTNYSKKLLGSILIAKRIQKEDDSKKYENTKNSKFLQVSRLKMKWKTIKWILEHKKDVLDRLMDFHENILKISNLQARDFDKGLTKSEFTTIMKRNGITNDLELINKIFWVFDEDGDNDLKYKEIAFGIEMFRDSTIDQKLKAFFDLCDTDNSGSISKLEFFNLMKKNIINNDEKMSMKDVVDKIFSTVKLDKNGDITFEQLKEGCEKNKEIQTIIYKNLLALKSIDTVIDKDVKKDIMQFNPELNEQLRMKLLSMKTSYTPLREEKFTRLLNDFVSNREKLLEIKKELAVQEEESYQLNQEDSFLIFKEESDLVKPIVNNEY